VRMVRGAHEPRAGTYTLTVRQHTPPTPGQEEKAPLHIPLAVGLLDRGGKPLPLRLKDGQGAEGTMVLELREAEQNFIFEGLPAPPVPSLLRGFSAPVRLDAGYEDADLRLLMANDTDPFGRWEAGHAYATRLLLRLIEEQRRGRPLALDEGLAEAFAAIQADAAADPAFVAEALTLPGEGYLGQQMAEIDVDAIHAVREFVRAGLGRALRASWLEIYDAQASSGPYRIDARSIGRRSLRNTALAYLMAADDPDGQRLCLAQFEDTDNMTDRLAALDLLTESDAPGRDDALSAFYVRWRSDDLVIDKWFTIQAMAQRPDALDVVERLRRHPAFRLNNPNRMRALIGAFAAANPTGFHRADGAGYAFIADRVLELDRQNPQIAARLLSAFRQWRRYDKGRQALMQGQLERILKAPGLSRDSYEIASKSLK
jgi:aminopeptidase N